MYLRAQQQRKRWKSSRTNTQSCTGSGADDNLRRYLYKDGSACRPLQAPEPGHSNCRGTLISAANLRLVEYHTTIPAQSASSAIRSALDLGCRLPSVAHIHRGALLNISRLTQAVGLLPGTLQLLRSTFIFLSVCCVPETQQITPSDTFPAFVVRGAAFRAANSSKISHHPYRDASPAPNDLPGTRTHRWHRRSAGFASRRQAPQPRGLIAFRPRRYLRQARVCAVAPPRARWTWIWGRVCSRMSTWHWRGHTGTSSREQWEDTSLCVV